MAELVGIHPEHLRKVIVETLDDMGGKYASLSAINLLMMIAAHESKMGRFLWQHRNGGPAGPAIGVYQMEPIRWRDTAERMTQELREVGEEMFGDNLDLLRSDGRSFEDMAWDLRFATFVARAALWIVPKPLPPAEDLAALDAYWFHHWCQGCKGKQGDAKRDYERIVLSL